ncbi:Pkinase-domain-containing protein [Calocera viscosa TUFC12733]|uniref:non-specific serine/threonine protein kinase n=1 Tax=Calocera viscosa (strain TUFC12733) TaxID=1330018 RepID=A0A167RVL7_CALVF|nr:Pkinase-domain-containing protein [Calocera viscosa TUFC12733]
MSWKIGKNATLSSKSSNPSLTASADISRSTTPTPGNLNGSVGHGPVSRSGLLTVCVSQARGLSLPAGIPLPPAVDKALRSQEAQVASSVSAASVSKQQQQARSSKNRESLQRKQVWWLPYVIIEFDKNEILLDALGGDISAPVWMYRTHFDVSRSGEVSLQLYLRSGAGDAVNDAGVDSMGKSDLYLGGVKFMPDFEAASTRVINEWIPLTGGSGEVNLQIMYKPISHAAPLTVHSFELLQVIGKGSFGKVMQVRKRDTGRIYALKTIRKAHIVSRSEVTHTLAERTVLAQVNNPFIVPLKFSYQSPEKLYLVLAFVNGGELFHHLQREQRFSEERSRFYAAELLLALEHLHDFNVVYRDLKPENILLDYTGHIALCDFGLCKLNMTDNETTNTFCGTPEYLAPELLLNQGYTKTVDWWTLGVLLYEMMTGLPPFYDENTNEMYKKILYDPLVFPDDMGSEARSILTGLLNRDPSRRLGVNGAQDIKAHPFFSRHIDWRKLAAKKIQPPFKPSVASAIDTSNFDQVFTSEEPLDSVVADSQLSSTVQAQFAGFSYDGRGDEMAQSVQSGI